MFCKCHFILIAFLFLIGACNKHSNTDYKTNEVKIHEIFAASLTLEDSLRTTVRFKEHKRIKPTEFNALSALRKIVHEERVLNYKGHNLHETVRISNPDSIETYTLITHLFPTNTIEQLSYDGVRRYDKYSKNHLQMGTLLCIKFKDNKETKVALERFYEYGQEDRRKLTNIFKPGGMVFILESQLCLYSVNTCGPGYKNLERLDSIIFRNVFYDENFERLHAKCGMQPFKRLIN